MINHEIDNLNVSDLKELIFQMDRMLHKITMYVPETEYYKFKRDRDELRRWISIKTSKVNQALNYDMYGDDENQIRRL